MQYGNSSRSPGSCSKLTLHVCIYDVHVLKVCTVTTMPIACKFTSEASSGTKCGHNTSYNADILYACAVSLWLMGAMSMSMSYEL